MKKYLKFLVLILCIFIITGCGKNYKRDDIIDYLDNTLKIKGYTLSDEAKEVKDNDNFTDYYWQVKYKDINFYVIVDKYYSQEHSSTRLTDTMQENVLEHYYYIYSQNTIKLEKYMYDHYSFICNAADNNKNINESELKTCYSNIKLFLDSIDTDSYRIGTISVAITTKDDTFVKWMNIVKDNKIKTIDEFINQ